MKIIITGQGIDTGNSLQTRITERLESIDAKHNARLGITNVVVSSAAHNKFHCKISALAPSAYVAEGSSETAAEAFASAAVKFEKQIRRNARQQKDVPHEKLESHENEA